jgi:uncharacterized phage protein (TIGR02220 family)
LDDPDLDNLELCDFARWAKLGALIKRQGNSGEIHLQPPARALCAMFQVPDYDTLLSCFTRLPNVIVRRAESPVSLETNVAVTFRNWVKYQGDYSTARVRQFREMKRSKRRGEETRREQTRKIDPNGSMSGWRPTARRLLDFLNEKTGRTFRPVPANLTLLEARLKEGATEANVKGVIARKVRDWHSDPKMSAYLRPKTLFNATNFAQYLGEREAADGHVP